MEDLYDLLIGMIAEFIEVYVSYFVKRILRKPGCMTSNPAWYTM